MEHPGLKIRMVLSGAIVFGFYVLVALVLRPFVGLPAVLGLSVLFAVAQYWLGRKLALRSIDATALPEEEYPEVHRRVEALCEEMELEKPRLVTGEMGTPNAFAVGRQGAGVVAVSESMLGLVAHDAMGMDELEGILAHELAHLRNGDVVVMVAGQAVATIVGFVAFLAVDAVLDDIPIIGWIVPAVVGAVVNMLVMVFVLVISRYREYVADRDAVAYTDDPDALASALATLDDLHRADGAESGKPDDSVEALCFFGGERGLLGALFATHPPVERRIERLRSLSG